jgi:hypothetical protein
VLEAGIVGRIEKDVALDLEIAMRRRGPEGPVVRADRRRRAAQRAAARRAARRRDPAGTLITIDWGAQLDGYASDCTRTFATGELDPQDREIFDLVLRAQTEALAAVRPGPLGKEVDAVARAIIDGAGHAEHFGHGLGHGSAGGPRGPAAVQAGRDRAGAGQIVTVEPASTSRRLGVRIEDLVAITETATRCSRRCPRTCRWSRERRRPGRRLHARPGALRGAARRGQRRVVAGMLAGEGPAEVTIMRPGRSTRRSPRPAAGCFDAGGTLLAEATPLSPEARTELEGAARPPRGARSTRARAAAAATPLAEGHPFPTCFGCRARPPERPALPGRPGRATACGR